MCFRQTGSVTKQHVHRKCAKRISEKRKHCEMCFPNLWNRECFCPNHFRQTGHVTKRVSETPEHTKCISGRKHHEMLIQNIGTRLRNALPRSQNMLICFRNSGTCPTLFLETGNVKKRVSERPVLRDRGTYMSFRNNESCK